MVTIIEELEAFIKEREATYRDALAEARKVILEGLQALQQEFPQLVPTPMCNICQHRGSTPPQTKAVTGHAPPTTTNTRQHVPPPPSRWHSHTQGVAHKCTMQSSQPAHTTTSESPRPRAATPTVEEGASTTPGHVAKRPKGLSTPLVCTTATRPKC